jgi:hypothetical protein
MDHTELLSNENRRISGVEGRGSGLQFCNSSPTLSFIATIRKLLSIQEQLIIAQNENCRIAGLTHWLHWLGRDEDTFLKTCELTFARHEHHEGREILIFTFTSRPGAQFSDDEKYIAQLTGEIWIDAQDRIVTRLVGRPTLSANNASPAQPVTTSAHTPADAPPAVYVEMMRLPEGVWLPRIVRINGVDYNKLFDGMTWESTWTFSNFRRFSTEIKDVKINSDSKP